jgi:ribokinase
MKKPSIVVVGSSNTDMIVQLDRIPAPGETLLGGCFSIAAGGKGANQAVGAARAGGAVTFVARLGRDMLGDEALAGFRKDGVRVEHVVRDAAAPSGVALIFVAKDGENSIAVAGGANARLSPADVRKARAAIGRASVVLVQLETPLPTVASTADLAEKHGVPLILNPAPAQSLPDSLLKRVAILTPNDSETQLLTGVKIGNVADMERAANALHSRGVGTVVITLGARGAFVSAPDTRQRVPGFKVMAVDTTAAGDVFNGALAVALGEGMPLLEAVRFSNAAAAISVTRHGAQPSIPHRRDIEKLLKSRP